MFELEPCDLRGFYVPAELMCPASAWEDWTSPLTRYITLNHLSPSILVSRTDDNDQRSVKVTMSISDMGSRHPTTLTKVAVLKADS